MAEDTVDRAAAVADLPYRPCPTRELKLHGYLNARLPPPLDVYGADTPALIDLLSERPEWRRKLHPNLPYWAGEVVWAALYKLARNVEDVLARRTRASRSSARASVEAASQWRSCWHTS